jgi:fibronectin type 3 domain-containing protein
VAAYSFDQGSGTTLTDHSGNGNHGTINGPAWTGAGRYGGALTFDGVNDIVTIADAASLDLTSGMTLEAWIRPTALGNSWRTVLLKEQTGNYTYALYASTGTGRPSVNAITGGADRDLRATSSPALNTWTHLAGTYNGSTLTIYLNGVAAGTLATAGNIVTSTGALRLGGTTIWPEWFAGQIDEVRVYNRSLSAAEIQSDMNASVGNPDSQAPTVPGSPAANGGLDAVNLSWTASSDNVGVTRYNVHRSTTAGFTPSAANRVAQPTAASHADTGLAPATYYYRVTAEDAAGNVSAPSVEASAVVTGDASAPSVPASLTASGSLSSVALNWTASTDNVAVVRYNVHRATTPGFAPTVSNRIAQPSGTGHSDVGLAAGTYYYLVTAEDAAGNVSSASSEASAAVTGDVSPPTAPASLNAGGGTSGTSLSWSAASDNVAVARYNVHRSTTSGFTPTAQNRIAQPTGTTYPDAPLAIGTYYYRVTAEDAAGNVGPASGEASAVVTGDITAPSVPSGLTATSGSGSISLAWTASTDNVGVANYNVHRSTTSGFAPSVANRIAQPSGTSYLDNGLAPGTYHYKVVAADAAGNVSAPSSQASATISLNPPGLVAAYAFDETSGSSVGDSAGANTGSISGATRDPAGRFGGALSFDGSNDSVTVPDAPALDLTNGMTLEAWVRPTALGSTWRTVVFKEQPNYYAYALYASTDTIRPSANGFVAGADHDQRGGASLPVNTWSHLAATFDGSTLRLFVDGVPAGSQAAAGSLATSTGPLRFGGNGIWGEYFQGLIDEVRVYNRALTQAEIQTDMSRSVGTPDTTAPSAPGTLTASGGLATATLSWGAATDDVAVSRYNVHRSTTPGFAPAAANRISQPTAAAYSDAGLAAGTYYYRVIAEDAAGNAGPASNEASATVTADTSAPTTPTGLAAVPGAGQAALSWNASTDNVGVARYDVHRSTTSGFVPSVANRIAQPTGTSHSDTGLVPGTYHYRVVAVDAAGNASAASSQVSATVTAAPPVGLVAAYGFDENSGTIAGDSAGANVGTLAGASWTIGKFGNALVFDGVNDWVTVADAATLDLTGGMTLEAWVLPAALGAAWRTVVLKEQPGNYTYALYASTGTSRPSGNAVTGGADHDLRGTATLGLGAWTHLTTTYDGANLRLYVDGNLVGTQAASGSISVSSGVLRIGGTNVWPNEFFQGRIDEVRVYNRALTQGQIQTDMATPAAADTRNPSVTAVTPANLAANVVIDARPRATFSEAMDASSITTSTFELRDGGGALVPASISFDPLTAQATLTPTSALVYGTAYTARLKSGVDGVKDSSGRSLAADHVWTFSVEPAPPPIAVLTSAANPYTTYLGEIVRSEGFSFASLSASLMSPAVLAYYDVILLGEMPLNAAQVTMLSDWVNAGGNLIAMRPDKQLAGLLGLSDAASTLANAYVRVSTATPEGAGIVAETIQYHGTADRYTLNGASSIATLYSNASTPTLNPAVTTRAVGTSGGQAAAFAYDLARSVVLTRQGNPAWVGQDRDGDFPIRPNDLFFGARVGDVQPDWVDTGKLAIPQADEQQRLLANLIVTMASDRKPLPRFWYLPRGEKAAIVMTGDDHAIGGTAGRFEQYKAASPPGCSVVLWECVRSTSYVYPASPLTNAQAAGYVADGFEVALHGSTTGGSSCANWTPASLASTMSSQLSSFASKYTSVPATATHRIHCVTWSDWATLPKVELTHGIRFDTNYYHHPASWIGAIPGFMTGSGLVMRFADTDGSPIDVYQAHTHMTDEAGQVYPTTSNALLDRALGPEGYYGIFTVNMHTDNAVSNGSDAIVSSAQARGVPIVSAKQMLDWIDGRNNSTFRSFSWSAGTLNFVVSVGAGAGGLEVLLPTQSSAGPLSAVTRAGSPVAFTRQTIKGIQYAVFTVTGGAYAAHYAS